jgi:Tfp pilus assembly protein PilF
VGEEAPEEAILYLEQLKESNTDFSPIYAQLAGLYLRQGNNILAIENMQEAVGISPENLAYKYNLAVMYDQAKQPERAVVLYRQLVKAGLDGAELPADLRDIQKRLTFLGTSP